MLTISGYKKLEGLVLKDGLKVETINEFDDRYSIWLSDKINIELERKVHWENHRYRYYKTYIGTFASNAMCEFVMTRTINRLDRMKAHLIYIHEKYINK